MSSAKTAAPISHNPPAKPKTQPLYLAVCYSLTVH